MLISDIMRWSTPTCWCCCSVRLLLVTVEVAFCVELCEVSPLMLPRLSAVEVISVMVTPGWSLEDDFEEVVEVLEEVTVRELVADELTALVLLLLVEDPLYVADCLRVMLPSGLWMTVSPESTSCILLGVGSAGRVGSAAGWAVVVPPMVPCCSLRLLVDTTPRSLAELYAEDEDSLTTFHEPVEPVEPVVAAAVVAAVVEYSCCCWRLCMSLVGDSESRISLDLSDMKPPWPWMDSVWEECVRTSPLSLIDEKEAELVFLAMICWDSWPRSFMVSRSRSTSPVV